MAAKRTPPRYPALFENATKESHPLGGHDRFVVGRSQEADLPVMDISCSRQHFQIVARGGAHYIEALSGRNPVSCDDVPVAAPVKLRHGAVIRAGSSEFVFLRSDEAVQKPAEAPAAVSIDKHHTVLVSHVDGEHTVFGPIAGPPQRALLSGDIQLEDRNLIGRDTQRASIRLPHPQVSRLHAQIVRNGGAFVITDLNSANGTFVNGTRIAQPTTLASGDRIDIGPYAITLVGTVLSPQSRIDNVEVVCSGVSRTVLNATTGEPVRILDDVSLVIRPKEFICLLGPSGSGKSTLLSALSARAPADDGRVTINGEDLYANFDALKHGIAVVPQKDVLHELLPLQTALEYTARLRLPPDTNATELSGILDELLQTVGLQHRRTTMIRHLSGGQIKRASLANEIISRPSLLFLDEVTSGLDEQTDAEMMSLFRKIAEDGKTVICVTHSLANVETACHRVVILAEGGKLAFVGSPHEALQYFGISRLGEIYKCLGAKDATTWQQEFRRHPLFAATTTRSRDDDRGPADPVERARPSRTDVCRTFWRQTRLLTARYVRIMAADVPAAVMLAGQCLLVALVMTMLFGDIGGERFDKQVASAPKAMFLLAVSALWFGCNNAAKEIVKESAIYSRERDVNLMVSSYYCSKAILLGTVTILQILVLFALVKWGTGVPGSSLPQFLSLATLGLAGVSLGLMISAVAKNTDVAATVVPMALIPQIVLAGAIVPVKGFAKFLSQACITSYWGYGGMVACLPKNIVEALEYDSWSAFGAWCVVVIHVGLYAALGVAVLALRDRRNNVYGKAIDRWIATCRRKASEAHKAFSGLPSTR